MTTDGNMPGRRWRAMVILLKMVGLCAALGGLLGGCAAFVVSSCCGARGSTGVDAAMLTTSLVTCVLGLAMLAAAHVLPGDRGSRRAIQLGACACVAISVFLLIQQLANLGVRRTTFSLTATLILFVAAIAALWRSYRSAARSG